MKDKKSFLHTLIRYVALQSASMFGLSLYILADTFFIARGVGSGGLTALNLVLPVYSLLAGIGLMCGVGGATVYAVLSGRGETERAGGVFSLALSLAGGAGVIFTLVGTLAAEPIARLLGASSEVLPLAVTYLRTISMFALAFVINQVMIAFVRNDGEPGRAMFGMLLGSGANIVLDYILIFPCGLGMFGAAFATCLAPILGILVQLGHFRKGRSSIRIQRPVPAQTGSVLAAGVPGMITEMSSGMVLLLFNFTILGLAGDVGVAAYGVVANLSLVVASIFTGVAQGIQPQISYQYGAGERERVRLAARFGLGLALVLGLVFLAVGLVGAEGLAAVFDGDGTPGLQEMAVKGIRIYFTAFPLMGINMVAAAVLAATTRSVPAMVLSLLRGLVLLLPGVLLLAMMLQMTGVWLTVPLVEAVTVVVSLWLCRELLRKARTVSV